jgi:hypothetical protein
VLVGIAKQLESRKMNLWLHREKRTVPKDLDRRVKTIVRFRAFALFWLGILVLYFVSLWVFVEETKTPPVSAIPIFVLLCGCIIIAAVWHAAAIVVMDMQAMLDKRAPPSAN